MAHLTRGVAAQESWTQEVVFLGWIFNKPEVLEGYQNILINIDVFKDEPAKSIWGKTAAYLKRYGVLPLEDSVYTAVFNEKEREVLNSAMEVASDPDAHTQFKLDSVLESIKLTLLKQMRSTMDLYLSDGVGDIDKTLALLDKTIVQVSKVSLSGTSTEAISDLTLLEQWSEGKLASQQPLLPIPLPGLQKYIAGSPRGEINYLIAPYGRGKTTGLCCLAAGYVMYSDVLYVSLEMPAANLLFKALSAIGKGPIHSHAAFYTPDGVDWEGNPIMDDQAEAIIAKHIENPYRLYFMDVPAHSIKASHIMNEVQRLRRMGACIDTVIIDYGDLLDSEHGGMMDVGWSYAAIISEELAAIAKNLNVNIWTASQTGKGLGSDSDELQKFRPMRGKDLWGSDGKMHTGCLALGMNVHRSVRYPRYGIGSMSTLKNRYAIGGFFGDLIIKVDYALSTIEVIGAFHEGGTDAQWADTIQDGLNALEATMRTKEGVSRVKKKDGLTIAEMRNAMVERKRKESLISKKDKPLAGKTEGNAFC